MTTTRHTVMIADDDPLVRRALSGILEMDGSLQVVCVCSNGLEAVESAIDRRPDLVLMDIHMPVMNGIDATARITQGCGAKVIMLTVDDDEDMVLKAIRAGASGFIAKDCDPAAMLSGIKKVLSGIPVIFPELSQQLLFKVVQSRPQSDADSTRQQLTDRESEVLELLAEGLSNREISDRLTISIQTVKSHVSSILEKLGVRDRTQAALMAMQRKRPG